MAGAQMRITFTLDETDISYFRSLARTAQKNVSGEDPQAVLKAADDLVRRVRAAHRVPQFVMDAMDSLHDLVQMMLDEDYALPKTQATRVTAALAYFANPEDVVPDHVPALGFLDDAIMIKLVEEEFRHELWAYRKFRAYRESREQRPWTETAKERTSPLLERYRTELRAKVKAREAADEKKSSERASRPRRGLW